MDPLRFLLTHPTACLPSRGSYLLLQQLVLPPITAFMTGHCNSLLAHQSPQLDCELLKTRTVIIISIAKLSIWYIVCIQGMSTR